MKVSMSGLLIRNVPEATRADLDHLADLVDSSLSDAAKLALGEGIQAAKMRLATAKQKVPMGDRLRGIFSGVFETNEEADEFHREIERERKSDFGRPLRDFE
jgi:hypothetical protein